MSKFTAHRLVGPGLGAGVALAGAALAVSLFLAPAPVAADGGPHVAAVNSGVSTLTADSCAGCHRAHTAQGPYLLVEEEQGICLSCHGAQSSGATTDVVTGVQYLSAAAHDALGAQLGALRSGGFDQARIASSTPSRLRYDTGKADFYVKVGVGAPADVTSSHLDLDGAGGVVSMNKAWGNGKVGSGAGPTVALDCASCHNPHGNGQYRILRPIPEATAATGSIFSSIPKPGQPILDSPVTNAITGRADTKNYTVIQVKGTSGNLASFWLYANQVTSGPTTGDYFHRYVPWNPPSTSSTVRGPDAPNGLPSSFNIQMTNWCVACHTRYFSTDPNTERIDPITGDPDLIYRYQHQTTTNGNTACTTCHVAHGSNAIMADTDPVAEGVQGFSSNAPYPDGTISRSSRLLKVDNRGTCQVCHDPTKNSVPGDYSGPTPRPGAP